MRAGQYEVGCIIILLKALQSAFFITRLLCRVESTGDAVGTQADSA
jgi:hypothetical protein